VRRCRAALDGDQPGFCALEIPRTQALALEYNEKRRGSGALQEA